MTNVRNEHEPAYSELGFRPHYFQSGTFVLIEPLSDHNLLFTLSLLGIT